MYYISLQPLMINFLLQLVGTVNIFYYLVLSPTLI